MIRFLALGFFAAAPLAAQPAASAPRATRPPTAADTEVWEPLPRKVVPPAAVPQPAPADAIVLFDGKNLDEWVATTGKGAAKWTVSDGVVTVNKAAGSDIQTKRSFRNFQLHVEWRVPPGVTGQGQSRGNSGVFLAAPGTGATGYEVQVLDNYENKTYVNGMAGSIYKQYPPLVDPSRPPGEWNSYDIAWTAPTFNDDGSLKTPARATVFFNGILVQNNVELKGETANIGTPVYKKYDSAPIKLQMHGDPSPPISFRNIWVRE